MRPAQLCPSKAGWSLNSGGLELQLLGTDCMGKNPSSTVLSIHWEGAHQPVPGTCFWLGSCEGTALSRAEPVLGATSLRPCCSDFGQ